jgi:alcohol dehydrogenase (cytochrome c)
MWRGKSVEVISFHIRRMPPLGAESAGSISDETFANILAYVLLSNDFAASDVELPADAAALAKFRIPSKPGAKIDLDAPVVASPEQTALLNNLSSVSDAMLRDPSPGDWLHWGRSYDGQNFTPLANINKENVSGLSLAWRAPLRPGSSMSAPLVHEGIMFLHTFPETVLAMDASNGDVLWRYRYEGTQSPTSKLGLGLHGDKVLVPTANLHVLALNAKTGELLWDHTIDIKLREEMRARFQLKSAPFAVGKNVIQGVTATAAPKGGFILAVDMETGKEAWRFNTIARPGEPGGNTWNELPIMSRSGGSVWHQGTYDAELNLIYFGVAPTYNTGPLLHSLNKEGVSNDAIYTNCTVALNADTGELVWHFQHLANDQWDLDWAFERQIVELPTASGTRKVVMNVGKIAILEALDAATGEYLFSVDSGMQNIVTAIDPKTGAKTIDPDKMPSLERPCLVCPHVIGARNWPPTSYSPQTNLVYVPIFELCMTMGPEQKLIMLTSNVGIGPGDNPDTADGMLARLQAIDVAGRKLGWVHDQLAPLSTGVLSTGGGVVFVGDVEPSLKAFDDATGELLWEAGLDANPTAGIISYGIGDKQYVAITVGMMNQHIPTLFSEYRQFAAKTGQPIAPRPKGGAAIWVFSLN